MALRVQETLRIQSPLRPVVRQVSNSPSIAVDYEAAEAMGPDTIDNFDPFNIFEVIDFLPTLALFYHLRVPRRLERLLPSREVRRLE